MSNFTANDDDFSMKKPISFMKFPAMYPIKVNIPERIGDVKEAKNIAIDERSVDCIKISSRA